MSNSFATPWTVACQVTLSMGQYWIGLQFPSPGALPDPGIRSLVSRASAGESLPLSHQEASTFTECSLISVLACGMVVIQGLEEVTGKT